MTGTYDVKLEDNKQLYSVSKQLSLWLKPQDPLRVSFRIGANRSGFHRFKIKLMANGRAVYQSEPIECYLLVPRETKENQFK